jgi:hypothetical protein
MGARAFRPLHSSFPELSHLEYSEFIKIAIQIIDLIFAKIIIFWKSSSLCFIFFSARAYALAEGSGARASPFGIHNILAI